MRWSALGLITGLVAGLALALDGFGAFLLVLVFGAIGLVAGKVADRELDLRHYVNSASARGRSWRRDRH